MIKALFKTIVILLVLAVLAPIILILCVLSSIEEMFRDKTKPMTKEEYYGWRL